MNKKIIKKRETELKIVGKYKKFCLQDKFNPFGNQDAYWAAGYENYLRWKKIGKVI